MQPFHGVQFYDSDAGLCRAFAAFLADGLLLGHPGVVIATDQHRAGIEACLADRGFDLRTLARTRQLRLFDADTLLTQLVVEGAIDVVRFQTLLAEAVAPIADSGGQLHACGELVDLLWKRGDAHLAIELEQLWRGAQRCHDIRILCGYDCGNRYIEHDVEDICGQHTHVIDDAGGTAFVSSGRV